MSVSGRKKILVVEDDTDVMAVIKTVLKTKGYEVATAGNGDEALTVLENDFFPDLVISDLRMPGMSGMELCKRLRANPKYSSIAILVISSLGSETNKPDAFWTAGLGSDDFLAKPFDPLGLLGRVEYLLRKNQYISEQATHQPQVIADGKTSGFISNDPSEVVSSFVTAWNTQNFSQEFDCLADEMRHGMSRQEYVQRRAQLFTDDSGATQHRVVDVQTVKVSNNVATVACLRDDVVRGVSRCKDERYTLRKSAQGWQIVNVRSRPMSYEVG